MFGDENRAGEDSWDDPWDDPEFLEELTIAAMAEPEHDTHLLPAGVDGIEPGPALAAFLSAIELDRLSGHDRVTALQAHQRLASHAAAQAYAAMVAIHDAIGDLDTYHDHELITDAAATEIRFALRLTRRAADAELDLALTLRHRLPRLWNALASGRLDIRRAKVIAHGTAHLPEGQARDVCDRALETAHHLTTGQLTAHLSRLCLDTNPGDAVDRYHQAVEERRVVVEPTVDGTAHLMALDLPPDKVAAAADHINRLAQNLKRDGETRTMDQLRADVVCDLLTGTTRGGKGGVVTLTIDLPTLMELADHPGDLAGYGPVISDIARQTADRHQHAEWRFAVTHPDSGRPVATGTTRRRPTRAQARQVELLHPTCISPGCRNASTTCDLDHTQPWTDRGPTEVDNLAPLCRHDHRIRHAPGFSYAQLPDGDFTWTTPLGHTHTTSGRSP